MGSIISDIVSIAGNFSFALFSFVPRVANGVAHKLAQYGLLFHYFHWWHVNPQKIICDVLLEDSLE